MMKTHFWSFPLFTHRLDGKQAMVWRGSRIVRSCPSARVWGMLASEKSSLESSPGVPAFTSSSEMWRSYHREPCPFMVDRQDALPDPPSATVLL